MPLIDIPARAGRAALPARLGLGCATAAAAPSTTLEVGAAVTARASHDLAGLDT